MRNLFNYLRVIQFSIIFIFIFLILYFIILIIKNSNNSENSYYLLLNIIINVSNQFINLKKKYQY